MLITFYHSSLCPRCVKARKHLKDLLGDNYKKRIIEIDALRHPLSAWKKNIRMIPALQCKKDILSGIMLSYNAISTFLSEHEDVK